MIQNTPNYGKIIAAARASKNITQSELGSRIGIGKTMICNYETGYVSPNLKSLEKIAAALDLSMMELLAFDSETENCGFELPRAIQPANDKYIRFFEAKNICMEKLTSARYMDSYITVPGFMLAGDGDYICIKIPDNSMKEHDLSKNDFVFIRQTENVTDGDTVLAVNPLSNTYTLRKYFRENHQISLTTVNNDQDYGLITYDERDNEYTIIGYVEKVLKNLR